MIEGPAALSFDDLAFIAEFIITQEVAAALFDRSADDAAFIARFIVQEVATLRPHNDDSIIIAAANLAASNAAEEIAALHHIRADCAYVAELFVGEIDARRTPSTHDDSVFIAAHITHVETAALQRVRADIGYIASSCFGDGAPPRASVCRGALALQRISDDAALIADFIAAMYAALHRARSGLHTAALGSSAAEDITDEEGVTTGPAPATRTCTWF